MRKMTLYPTEVKTRITFSSFILFMMVLGVVGCKDLQSSKQNEENVGKPIQNAVTPAPAIPQPPKGQWITPKRDTLVQTIPAIGTFYPNQSTKLGPQVSGRVEKIYVDVGDFVRKGQKLVELDSRLLTIELQQTRANYNLALSKIKSLEQNIKSLESEVVLAKNNVEDITLQLSRMKALWEGSSSSIARQQYDSAIFAHRKAQVALELQESRILEAQTQINQANCAVKQAEEAMNYAQQRLNEATIYAPYDGIVTGRLVDTGEPATSAPIVHVIALQEVGILKLEFTLPQYMLSYVRENTPIEFEVEGIPDSKTPGKIAVIFPILDEATRSIRCRAFIKNSDFKFKPGLLAKVHVVTKQWDNVLVVPRRALLQTAQGWKAWTDRKGVRSLEKIQAGFMNDTQAEIQAGLSDGEKILVME